MLIILKFPASEDYFMSSSLVWHFVDEKATFARGRVLGHTGLPLYESSFYQINQSWVIELYTHTVSADWTRSSLGHFGKKTMKTYANIRLSLLLLIACTMSHVIIACSFDSKRIIEAFIGYRYIWLAFQSN